MNCQLVYAKSGQRYTKKRPFSVLIPDNRRNFSNSFSFILLFVLCSLRHGWRCLSALAGVFAKQKLLCLIAAGMLLLNNCFSPYTGEGNGSIGTISINVGGNGMAVITYPPTSGDILQLEQRVQLQGSSGTENHTLAKGVTSGRFSVAPGLWKVTINSYHGSDHYATGTGIVDVKAGRDNAVTIQMGHIHIWTSVGTPTLAPTCTTTGIGPVTCTHCPATEPSGVIPALGHNYSGWTQITAPTCITAGVEIGTCTYDVTHTTTRTGVSPTGIHSNTSVVGSPAHQTGICQEDVACNHLLYEIGDTGPANGIIFYRSSTGFTVQGFATQSATYDGTTNGYTAHYLEARPFDGVRGIEPVITWAIGAHGSIPMGTGTLIGAGRRNLALIEKYLSDNSLGSLGMNFYAFEAGKPATPPVDWFLLSLDELNALWDNKAIFSDGIGLDGAFTAGYYWTSSEVSNVYAYARYFLGGIDGALQTMYYKDYNTARVRPIRAF